MLDVHDPDAADALGDEEPGDADDRPVVFAREIRPPLRRWAAGPAVRSDPSCWGALVQRARQIDPRTGAAIVHGVLDRIDVLVPVARNVVLDLAENWPHRKVREAATALQHPPEPTPTPATGTMVEGEGATPALPSTARPSLF